MLFPETNTGKQQFTANQSIYQLLDKDCSVPDDIDLWHCVWTLLKRYFMEKINFIYSADKTFRIIRIIDFNRTEPTCYRTYFHCTVSGEQNGAFLVHSASHQCSS